MFYLLLYGILRLDRLSQRGLCDAFTSPMFQLIFKTPGKKRITHSSISERLSVIEIDFLKKAYDCMYKHFSSLYTSKEIERLNLQRVDSTLVSIFLLLHCLFFWKYIMQEASNMGLTEQLHFKAKLLAL